MNFPFRSPKSLRVLSRLTWGSALSLSLCSLVLPLGSLYASAQTVPSAVRSSYGLLDRGLVNQAIAQFERTLRQYPRSLEAQLGLAIAYRRAGRDADAFQAYERVLTIEPNNRLSLLSLGTLGGYRPEWQDRGIAALDTLLQQSPADAEARTQRALLYVYQGRVDEAIADYEMLLADNPTPAVLAGAAQAYAYQRQYNQSLSLFDRYRQTGGTLTGDAVTAYARALRETGNPTAAVQALETPIRQQPNLTGTTIRMRAEQALNYAAIDRFDLAASMLAPLRGRADSRMPLGRSLVAIGQAYQKPELLEEGLTLFQTVLADADAPPPVKREIAGMLGSFPETYPAALVAYQQLSQQQPDDRSLQTQVAVLEYETGARSEADLIRSLTQTLQSIPPESDQQDAIVQALIQIRTPNPRLLPLYENLVRLGNTEPLLYVRIAQMYVRQGEYDTARSVIASYQNTPNGRSDAAADLILAGIDQRQGNLAASAERYQALIASNPADKGILSGALQGLAGIYQSQGQFQEALTLYNRVVSLNPNDPTKRLGLVGLQYLAGAVSRSAAEQVLSDWLSKHPLTETPPELYSLVAALPANPRIELLYQTLLQADPTNLPVQSRWVEVMAERNQTAAMDYIDQLIAQDPENINLYFIKGQTAQRAGNLNDSAAAYEVILERQPQNLDALASLGGVRFQQRRYDSAIDLYSQILAVQPDHPIARSALASLENVRQYPRRIRALHEVEQQEQENPSLLPDLNSLETEQPSAEFSSQGEVPLPWDNSESSSSVQR